MSTRIGIIGVGAIGGVVGGMLTKAGHDVTLVDQWPEHVEAMRKVGLRLSGTCGEHLVPVRALNIHELQSVAEPFDAIFIAVKSYDTEWATQMAVDHLRQPDGVVVDFQNGINDHRVAAVAGRERTLGCVILISAGMYEPAHAIRTDRGNAAFKIGEHDGTDSPRARRIAQILSEVAPAVVTTNLWGERWSKLVQNSMGNGVTAATGLTSGDCLRNDKIRRFQIRLAGEAVRVGQALGYTLERIRGADPERLARASEGDAAALAEVEALIVPKAGANPRGDIQRPSMAQDILKGRRTEIDAMNGYIARKGAEVGVPAPSHARLAQIVTCVERGELAPSPSHLEG